MDLISDSDKASMASAFQDLHDTWGRDITIYKTAAELLISDDPNYNFAYNNPNVNYTPISQTFKGRILYGDKGDLKRVSTTESRTNTQTPELRSEQLEGLVRIKLPLAALDFIKDFKEAKLDGETFYIMRDFRPHGLFDPQFYTIYLKKIQ